MALQGSSRPVESESSRRPRVLPVPGTALEGTDTAPGDRATPTGGEALDPKWVVAIDSATD